MGWPFDCATLNNSDVTLYAPSTLGSGSVFCNDDYEFYMQPDGNLVLYRVTNDQDAIWASGTSGNPGAHVTMQSDGNFVVYASNGRALWATGTYNHPGSYFRFQTDGNLVVYTSGGSPIWASGTYGK